ncbi:MAG: DoxX family protein [Planctomycetota bacterium]
MRSLFQFPLRLAVGWGISPRILSLLAMTMLVILRLSIGWHFHSEGIEKYRQGDWDATPFFANARGPLADEFKKLVWDRDGKSRRDLIFHEWWLAKYNERAAEYFSFTEKEEVEAEERLQQLLVNVQSILEEYEDDLREYDLRELRIAELKGTRDWANVESLAGQIKTLESENQAKLKPAMAEIDELWDAYELSINALAAPNQQEESPALQLRRPRTERVDTSVINQYLPFFDLAIGWCLLLGLFTPVAALAAAVFLGSVFLSQYPPGTGPTSSNYQLIESMACLVIASTGAGRYAGLDYFIHLYIRSSQQRQD